MGELDEIRQKLGGLSVDELKTLKSLTDNELKARLMMVAMSFKAGEVVFASCPDGIERECLVEYPNKVTVVVRDRRDGTLFRMDPADLRRVE